MFLIDSVINRRADLESTFVFDKKLSTFSSIVFAAQIRGRIHTATATADRYLQTKFLTQDTTSYMAACPYCNKRYAADTLEAQNDRSGLYSVFTCPEPECDVILAIVKS